MAQLRFDRSGALLAVLERIIEPAQLPALPPQPVLEDDEDSAALALAPDDGALADTVAEPASTELETLVTTAASGPVTDVAQLFRALTVERAADGGLRIEAPPHAAAALISMFEGMAKLLGGASVQSAAPRPTNGASARSMPAA